MIDADSVDVMHSADGAELLDEVLAVLTRYVVLPNTHAAAAVTLWIATTHALPAFGEIDRARHTVQTVVSATERRGVTGG
ncbi:hypothetical protein [Mycobacterium sp. URHB0021]|jgi:hypothetical protein